MGKEYTKQHIVPSCYIANFGANGNEGRKSSIYYYLKEKGISGCGCAGDFPVEGNYYDIPELGENKKILELLFQKIETDLSDLLKELICSITFEKKDRKGCYVDYPLSKRQALSAQFAMQIQRTNLLRKQFEYIYNQLKAHVPCSLTVLPYILGSNSIHLKKSNSPVIIIGRVLCFRTDKLPV